MRPSTEEPPSRRQRAGAAVRGAFLDLSPLKASPQFRVLWLGEAVSQTGRHITVVALAYQVYQLTRSPLLVGLIGLAQVVPLMTFSIVGGAIADHFDRRKVLLATQSGLAATGILFVGGAIAGEPPLWLLYATAALQSALTGLDAPARIAAIPNLVPREQLSSALALNQVLFQVSDIAGPALGGLIIANLGLVWAYGADVASFGAAIVAIAFLRPLPPQRAEGEAPPPRGVAAIREGFAYLRGRRVIQSTFMIDLIAMVFGMPRALFPVLAAEVFHVGPAGLGLMFSAPAAGALTGALFTGWVRRVRHQGRAVLWAVTAWGLAIVAFGLSTELFWLALLFLAAAGAADVFSAIFRGTILQSSVPDAMRGRLSSIHFGVVAGGPRLGDLEAGLVAQLTTPVFSVVSGGVAVIVGVVALALMVPELARYHAGEPA
jgi:MFS family permease